MRHIRRPLELPTPYMVHPSSRADAPIRTSLLPLPLPPLRDIGVRAMRSAAFALLFACLCIPVTAQDAGTRQDARPASAFARVDTLLVTGDTVQLPFRYLLRGREVRIASEAGDGELGGSSVVVDTLRGRVVLARGVRDSLLARSGRGELRLVIRSHALPVADPGERRLRTLVTRVDSARGDTIRTARASAPITIDNVFGPDLQKSGYLGRGFTVGSNRDLSLNSDFRLQLSGTLADDIEVVAALTDENTPIQPEGNTRTLQELDKVFVKISSPALSATLGDFTLGFTGTEFGRTTRKLSGALGEGRSDDSEAAIAFASLKGAYRSQQFAGLDGVQGPYRLAGKNGEQRIVVLAGTERVYIDGVQVTRGETHDYVIDYSSGELTFTPRRLITSASRITVDFEYAERQYVRTLFAAGARASVLGERLRITTRYLREGDDQDSPLDLQLTDEDRRLLAAAGEDPSKAAAPGAVWVGLDSSGRRGAGQYVRVDTTIDGRRDTAFRYDPGADSATWSVTYSYVGTGRGAYVRRAFGIYTYAGPGRGEYAPVRMLPLPQLQQVGVVQAEAAPLPGLEIGAEGAMSHIDRNRFSDQTSADASGGALNARVRWQPSMLPPGALDISARMRLVEARFLPIDRINDIEFDRAWDIRGADGSREELREASITGRPLSWMQARAGAGRIDNGTFSSTRVDGGLTLGGDTSVYAGPETRWSFESITSSDSRSRSSWFRQRGEASRPLGLATPRVRFEHEHRTAEDAVADTLLAGSFGFIDVRPGVELRDLGPVSLAADVGIRLEDAWSEGAIVRQSTDLLQQYSLSLRTWHDLSGGVTLTVRDRRYAESFRARGNTDMQTILTRAQVRHTPFGRAVSTDLLYEVSTERTSRLERQFIRVPIGQGTYIYRGDLNGNGLPDEAEFEPARYDGEYVAVTVPTDELFPVIDLRASARVQFQASRLDALRGGGWFAALLRPVSTETILRVEEKNSDERTGTIYLLHFSRFLNDSTTLRGFQNMRQDLSLFEQSQDFSIRFRFDQSRGFSQFALATERSFRRERSIRVKTQPVREIGAQIDVAVTNDAVATSAASNRARSIAATALTADFSYRPAPRVEVGFVLHQKGAVDSHGELPLEAEISAQTIRTGLTFEGPGRLRVELERSQVGLSTETQGFPFELTDGRAEGLSWIIRVNLDYRFTSFLQSTLSYLGRTEGGRPFLHTARAEVRAFF